MLQAGNHDILVSRTYSTLFCCNGAAYSMYMEVADASTKPGQDNNALTAWSFYLCLSLSTTTLLP